MSASGTGVTISPRWSATVWVEDGRAWVEFWDAAGNSVYPTDCPSDAWDDDFRSWLRERSLPVPSSEQTLVEAVWDELIRLHE